MTDVDRSIASANAAIPTLKGDCVSKKLRAKDSEFKKTVLKSKLVPKTSAIPIFDLAECERESKALSDVSELIHRQR
jgi:hypothetical protein